MKKIFWFVSLIVLFWAYLQLPANDENSSSKVRNYVNKPFDIQLGTLLSVNKVKTKNKKIPTDFSFRLNGKEISFRELTKGKNVIINFWATGCAPCKTEIPGLIEISNEYKTKNWIVIGILKEPVNSVTKCLEELEIPYINIVGTDKLINDLNDAYGRFRGTPYTIFINNSGKIYQSIQGAPEGSKVKEILEEFMKNNK